MFNIMWFYFSIIIEYMFLILFLMFININIIVLRFLRENMVVVRFIMIILFFIFGK